MMSTPSIRALLACALALLPTAASANPLDHFGFGSRAVGLAGASTAIADDFSANFYNPAALARMEDLRIELGYLYVEPFLGINGADLDVDPTRGFQGGVVIPGELLGQRFGFSLGLFLPDERITRIRALPQSQPRFVLYDNRPQRIVISTSLGVEILDDLYLGGGVNFLAHTRGTLDMEGQVHISDPERTELFTGLDVSLTSIRYPTFGILWTPGNWRLGLTYREEFSLELELAVDVGGDLVYLPSNAVLAEDASFVLVTTDNNLFSPRSLAFGAAYETEDWLISADLTWQQWSRFPSPTARITIDFDLGDAFDFSLPPLDTPTAPDFKDILVPRLAGELRVLDTTMADLTLRAGYAFEPTPAPPQRGQTNFVDNRKHTLAFGASMRLSDITPIFPKPIILELAGLLAVMPELEVTKDDPADFIGDYTAGGFLLGTSLSARFHF